MAKVEAVFVTSLNLNAKCFLESEARTIAMMGCVTNVSASHKAERIANAKGAIVGYLYCLNHNAPFSPKDLEQYAEYYCEILPKKYEKEMLKGA